MPLHFPRAADDIRFLLSPLAEVICQVRFPPILVIAAEEPAEFQEQVRKRFPLFETELQGFNVQLNLAGGAAQPLFDTQSSTRMYRFLSADSATTLSLAVDFFALSTHRYTIWEHFAADLALAYEAVAEVYKPPFATRIGLRYVDRISPSKLGLPSLAAVAELLRDELSTAYRTDAWDEPAEMICHLVLKDDSGNLSFRYGKRTDLSEPTIVLDFDYFEEGQLPLENLVQRCNRYHQIIYDAFRWSIREDKIEIFQPVAKEAVPQ